MNTMLTTVLICDINIVISLFKYTSLDLTRYEEAEEAALNRMMMRYDLSIRNLKSV